MFSRPTMTWNSLRGSSLAALSGLAWPVRSSGQADRPERTNCPHRQRPLKASPFLSARPVPPIFFRSFLLCLFCPLALLGHPSSLSPFWFRSLCPVGEWESRATNRLLPVEDQTPFCHLNYCLPFPFFASTDLQISHCSFRCTCNHAVFRTLGF